MNERRGSPKGAPGIALTTSVPRLRTEAGMFAAFLVIGGICALINLGIVTALTLEWHWAYLPAALIATEVSVFIGFLLNDRFTFRELAMRAGGWWGRCLRFHGGYALSQVLTIGLSLALISFLGLLAAVAHAISLAVITFVNFGIQRSLTYSVRR